MLLRFPAGGMVSAPPSLEVAKKRAVAQPMTAVEDLALGFSEKYRHFVGYSGYTLCHLPVCVSIPLLRRVEATPAIFDARMARSSFVMRSFAR